MRPIAARAMVVGRAHTRYSGHTGITRHSPRSGLRLIRSLPGEPCSIATVTCGTDRKLDTDVGGVRTTRFRSSASGALVSSTIRVHRNPPRAGTLRDAPLNGTGWEII